MFMFLSTVVSFNDWINDDDNQGNDDDVGDDDVTMVAVAFVNEFITYLLLHKGYVNH